MQLTPFRFAAALRRTAQAGLLATLGLTGCDAILGITDVEPDPTGGGGSGVSATTAAGGDGSGGSGGTTTTMTGGGGSGGSTASGDFQLGLKTVKVELPIAGTSFVDVEIVPKNGFDQAVTISLAITPNGVTFEGTTIAAGQTTGQVKIGAGGGLQIGDKVPLTFVASAGGVESKVDVEGSVTGTPGTLVETFGAAGVASWVGALDGTNVFDVREVAQNKIIVTGDSIPGVATSMKGARVLQGGNMDPGFGPGADGVVTAQFCGCSKTSSGRAALREIGGRVLMIGTGNKGSGFTDDIAVARFKDNGTFDNVGGDEGKALIDLGGIEETGGAAMLSNGKVVVGGTTGASFFVARLNSFYDGLDTNFAAPTGFVTLPGVMPEVTDLAVDAADGVYAVGHDNGNGDGLDIVILHVLASGVADPAFGNNGLLRLPAPGDQRVAAVTVDGQGRVVVAGDAGGGTDLFLLRLLPDGTLDPTFGNNGVVSSATPAQQEVVTDMVLLADGRIVVGGNTGTGPFLARYLTDGAPDPTFGTMGFKSINLGMDAKLQALFVTGDGRLLVAGNRESQPAKGFVAKVWQ